MLLGSVNSRTRGHAFIGNSIPAESAKISEDPERPRGTEAGRRGEGGERVRGASFVFVFLYENGIVNVVSLLLDEREVYASTNIYI